ATDGQLGEDDQIGRFGFGMRARGKLADQARVAGEVSDGGVDLGESELHTSSLRGSRFGVRGGCEVRVLDVCKRLNPRGSRPQTSNPDPWTMNLAYVPVPEKTTPTVRARILRSSQSVQFST